MSSPEFGGQFLHEANPQLHNQPEVELTAGYLRAAGERIPDEPDAKLNAHLGFLANREYVNDGFLTGDQQSIERQIEFHLVKESDIPESYFSMLARVDSEQGFGYNEFDESDRHEEYLEIRQDQTASLKSWITYFNGDGQNYPDWFKQYAMNSIVTLADFDKTKNEFRRRSRGTTASFPELNREALSNVYQAKAFAGKKAGFAKLYSKAMHEVTPVNAELRQNTEGSWVKFESIDGDYQPYYHLDEDGEYIDDSPTEVTDETALKLAHSLQGYGTGWCTAGVHTAASQLQDGDFYVYYSKDAEGNDNIPRIAIRMEEGEVAEVRGIDPNQQLEVMVTDIAIQKLQELPGGELYLTKAEDMKRLTQLERRIKEDSHCDLSVEALIFLYEVERDIEGFGYEPDPRIHDLRWGRPYASDLRIIFGLPEIGPIASIAIEKLISEDSTILDEKRFELVVGYLYHLLPGENDEGRKFILSTLMENENYDNILANKAHLFDLIDFKDLAGRMVSSGMGDYVLQNLARFPDGTVPGRDLALAALTNKNRFAAGRYNFESSVNINFEKFSDPQELVDIILNSDDNESLVRSTFEKIKDFIDVEDFTSQANNNVSRYRATIMNNLSFFADKMDHETLRERLRIHPNEFSYILKGVSPGRAREAVREERFREITESSMTIPQFIQRSIDESGPIEEKSLRLRILDALKTRRTRV